MSAVLVFSIILGASLLALAIIAGTIILAIRIIKGGATPDSRRAQAEEARMIQEIYQGLSSIEKRVESLETIIFDSSRKDRIDEKS